MRILFSTFLISICLLHFCHKSQVFAHGDYWKICKKNENEIKIKVGGDIEKQKKCEAKVGSWISEED